MNVNGILVLNKPAGMTSHDCVAAIRRIVRPNKVGHTGTLDPDATGVLPICVGKATRIAQYMLNDRKAYESEVLLGQSTTTDDAAGDVVDDQPLQHAPSRLQIEQVLETLTGTIEQVPPMYSAVHVNGKRLYELAREGKTVERKARSVHIHNLQLLQYDAHLPYPRMTVYVSCSKGTYIRSLAVQIGELLGMPAHITRLNRVESGTFSITESFPLADVQSWSSTDWQQNLRPIDGALEQFPKLFIPRSDIKRLVNGQRIRIENVREPLDGDLLYRVYEENENRFIALVQAVDAFELQPKKVFQTWK